MGSKSDSNFFFKNLKKFLTLKSSGRLPISRNFKFGKFFSSDNFLAESMVNVKSRLKIQTLKK